VKIVIKIIWEKDKINLWLVSIKLVNGKRKGTLLVELGNLCAVVTFSPSNICINNWQGLNSCHKNI
jgi:hypothetical protein